MTFVVNRIKNSKVSSPMKGRIAEDRIASLIVLYGDRALACYRPISDDEGIDLIVKEKGPRLSKTIYLQVKSRYSLTRQGKAFVSNPRTSTLVDSYRMAIIFCYFDLEQGDLYDYLWFIPVPDFLKKANKSKDGRLGFVASIKKGRGRKWDDYLIKKKDLANAILKLMARI